MNKQKKIMQCADHLNSVQVQHTNLCIHL